MEARDKYVAEKMRETLFNLKEDKVPKGVWFSTFIMSFPLFACTSYLALLSPIAANTAVVDPITFAATARSCVRLLSLNLAFLGGVHYGLGSATYDTARTEEEQKKTMYQIGYSFMPAFSAWMLSNGLLFANPLSLANVTFCFTGLIFTQFLLIKFDNYAVDNELAPLWFKKYRKTVNGLYMALTTVLFFIYYAHWERLQRVDDPKRIQNIKTALQLEDLDFIKMVEEMNLQLNEVDLGDMERKIQSRIGKTIPG